MPLMAEKGIPSGICHTYIDMLKKIINIWKIMIKILNHHTVDVFKWVKKLSKVNERFIKNYNEKSDQRYFLEVNVEIKVDVSKKNIQQSCTQSS